MMPGGRRERRLRSGVRLRTTRAAATGIIVAGFAAGTIASASADMLLGAPQSNEFAAETLVPAVEAPAADIEVVAETEEVTLEHELVEKSDPYSTSGSTTVVTEGEDGSATVHYDVLYENGVEVSRVERVTVVIDEPVDEVVSIGTLTVPQTTAAQRGTNRALGQQMAADLYGWTGDQWACLDNLWIRESNWRHTAANKSSGAYGIPQALPGSKMAKYGDDWLTNPATQIKWGLAYVKGRYQTPCGAWGAFNDKGWY
jgi:hypothetical protein